jgi:hypothetical protein
MRKMYEEGDEEGWYRANEVEAEISLAWLEINRLEIRLAQAKAFLRELQEVQLPQVLDTPYWHRIEQWLSAK